MQPQAGGAVPASSTGGLPAGLVAVEGGRIVFKAQIVVEPDQAVVNTLFGQGTFQAALPSLQINQATWSGGLGVPAGAEAAPALATQSPTQPISLLGPLSANTVTATTLQTSAGGAQMTGGAVTATSLSTTGGGAMLTGSSLVCSSVLADLLQTTEAAGAPAAPLNATAAAGQQVAATRGVTISGGVVSAAALRGDSVTSAGPLEGASLDVGQGSISGGSVSAPRIVAPSGTVTAATLVAQNAAVADKLNAASLVVKGDASGERGRRGEEGLGLCSLPLRTGVLCPELCLPSCTVPHR